MENFLFFFRNATYVYTTEYPPYYQYQALHSPNQQTYIIQQENSPNSIDDESSAQLGHTTRASPATIQWLINNYEPADGTSLPRCTLYSHYIKLFFIFCKFYFYWFQKNKNFRHCNDNKLEAVNAASFGKLIRSVFHGLRTRRLGTRGNSKYHYYGIRIKPDSLLNRNINLHLSVNDEYNRNNNQQHQMSTRNRNGPPSSRIYSTNTNHRSASFQAYSNNQNLNLTNNDETCVEMDREILGDGEVPQVPMPDMQGLENFLQPLGLTLQHAIKFIDGYTTNCAEVLECVKHLQFEAVEECWTTFWQPENEQEEMEEDDCMSNEFVVSFLKYCLLFIILFIHIILFDFKKIFLNFICKLLQKKSSLTTQIRNFAKSLEGQMRKAMHGAPDAIQKKKLVAIRMLAHTLRRYTSLNHLASAARGVLQKPDQIQQMFQDFNRVDITNVQDQAGWICDCDPILVSNLQSDFRDNLQKHKTLEQWADWMEAVVDQVLAKYHDKPFPILADVSKQFLKNWSFYSSMIIRDLTLRSAQSFGSFHLIRLLYDEYLLYLVELRLSKAANKPVISIMAETLENTNHHHNLSSRHHQHHQLHQAQHRLNSAVIATSNHSIIANNLGMMEAQNNHVFNAEDGVNIVYMDENSGQTHSIHYVDMVPSSNMDTLEQIVQSSDMTLEQVKNDLHDQAKQLDII
ncbi:unnamed protein product [Dracunculus medinensis]|uniref:RFX-type winged-helix domain-containing protein n=1 Tax=Dracunculus medinensis TaxID=318479 RepID=A0A158Q4E7_DRAME|nr:unnamed protein product [Dracunculus medinensis]